MTESIENKWFSEIDKIVTDPLRFKLKLAIGEDAYTSLKIKKAAWEIWDVAGVAATGTWLAQLPCVASILASKGVLVSLGLATGTTPIGWVALAGVLSGGAWLGITRYLKSLDQERVDVIPKFINTPLDVLALGLFDLIIPLALRVAKVDGHIDITERQTISSYFVTEWGYDERFVEEGIAFVESKLDDYKIKDLAQTLAEFQKQSPDCNFKIMSKEILSFLKTIIEADGIIDEREEMAIEKVKMVFDEVDRINFTQMAKNGFEAASGKVIDSSRAIKTKSGEVIEKTGEIASVARVVLKEQSVKAAEFVSEAFDSTMTHGKNSSHAIKAKSGEVIEKTGELTSVACTVLKEQCGKATDFVSDTCGSAMAQSFKIVGNLKSKVTTAVKKK